jgi:PAS domain S-box-containing protein
MSARHILVVEDERIVAAGLKHELEDFGYEVSGVASTADDAVEQAVREKPDLVLMDIHLGGERDGVDAAREIRARCGIPVVYLSAFADPETVARTGATEAYGYLLKPYEERELQTTIEVALAKHQSERRLAETERWLAAVLAGVGDAVIATDPGHQIHFMNLAAEALTGWRKDEAVGRPLAEVCPLRDRIGLIPLDGLSDLAVSESRRVELHAPARLVDRTGREKPVEGNFSPIFDPRGEFLGMALTLRDISDRLRAGEDVPS